MIIFVTYLGPLYLQLVSCLLCNFISAYYHNNNCRSQDILYFLRKFDLAGVCLVIIGNSTVTLYYSLMCEEHIFYQRLWIGIVWVSNIIALGICLHPNQKDFKNTWVLAASFISAGFSVLPGILYIVFFVDSSHLRSFPLACYTLTSSIVVVGAIISVVKWPERKYKVILDVVGNSHNIFHTCVVVAGLTSFYGSLRLYHERQLYSCPVV